MTAVLASTLVPGAVVPAQAAVAGMGAVDPQTGFPTWYSDGTVKLQLCYMAGVGCRSEPPNPSAPASYPDNFPPEAFWFDAEATGGNLRLYQASLEGSHVSGAVVPGQQMGFARLRFIVDNLQAGATYTVQHPYGQNTFVAEQDPKVAGRGRIKQTIDAGVCAPTPQVPCDWAGVGQAFLGPDAGRTTSTFLRQVGAPAGTLGDINTAKPVTGAPSGVNAVTITGPDAGGPGVNTLTIDLFTVQGLIYDGPDAAPSTPDLAAASDSGRSSTDNITNVTTPTLTGTVPGLGANEATVQLLVDGRSAPAAEGTTLGGAYSMALPADLTGGVHRVVARTPNPAYQVDALGAPVDPAVPQFLTSGTLTFTVDTTPPPVAVVSPRPSNPSLDSTPTLSFSVGEVGATTECQLLPSNPDWDPTCVSPTTYDTQLDGNYTFAVRATDVAGNVGTPATYTWHIGPPDGTPPTVAGQTPLTDATRVPLGSAVTVRFSEPVTGVSDASVVLDGPDGSPVPATVTYNESTLTATLRPTAPLASSTRYTLSLTNAIEDRSGNPYAGSTSSFTTADTVAPTLTSPTPAPDATDVVTTAPVTATFSEPVTGASSTSFTVVDPAGTAVPASVAYDETTRTATLRPTSELASSTTYSATLSSAVTDTSGNPLAPVTWTFTTAADTVAPSVSGVAPARGAVGAGTAGPVTATFTEPVQAVTDGTFTVRSASGVAVPATVAYDPAARTATLTPSAPLAASTGYTATLTGGTSGIRDVAGNPLADTSWTFTTAAPPDTTAPTVTARTPAANGTAVSQTGNLGATFSEPVSGVSATSFTLRNAATGAAVAATSVSYNPATRVATFDPKAPLSADTRYTASLTSAITDVAGNALPATSWTFTTGPAPTLTTRTPGPDATGVARTADVTATFSEPVAGIGATAFSLRNARTGAAVAATVSYNRTTRVATLDPNGTLAADSRYTVSLSTAVKDAGGNPLPATTWTFTTGPAPTVTARTPAVGATGVGRTANVTATFGEAVTGVGTTTFRLRNAATGATVTATVTRNGTTNQWVLDPGATLAASTRYTVTLTGGATAIRDGAGNALASTSWSFTTGNR